MRTRLHLRGSDQIWVGLSHLLIPGAKSDTRTKRTSILQRGISKKQES